MENENVKKSVLHELLDFMGAIHRGNRYRGSQKYFIDIVKDVYREYLESIGREPIFDWRTCKDYLIPYHCADYCDFKSNCKRFKA